MCICVCRVVRVYVYTYDIHTYVEAQIQEKNQLHILLCNCVGHANASECVRILLPYIYTKFFRFHFIRKHS